MRSPPFAALLVLSAASLAACSPRGEFEATGPVGRMITASARDHHVPRDLMAAIAHVEGGLRLAAVRRVEDDEAVPVAGVLELRHGGFDSLARGAALSGSTERELVEKLDRGTDAGARVLDDLARDQGIARDSLDAWAPVVERLSGHRDFHDRVAYRAKVFRVLRDGGSLRARGGEVIDLPPHDDVSFDLAMTPPAMGTLGNPEYPGAIWFDTPSSNKWTPGRDTPITMIAIHDTEGGWDASVATLQNDPGKSVHYIIDADGSKVGQFVSEGDTAWHAGNWFYNQRMIGIEHVGFAGDDDYHTELYVGSAALVNDIAKRNGLGPNGDGTKLDRSVLVGHQEVPNGNNIPQGSPPCPDSPGSCTNDSNYGGAGNHTDPGVNWEWCQYTEIIGNGATCKCNDAFEHFNCVHDASEMVRCADGATVEIVHCANHSCMVQPIGVDDTCGQVEMGSSSSSGSGSPAGSGGAGGGSMGSGGGGAGGAGGGDGGSSGDPKASSGCAAARGPAGGGSLAAAASILALAAFARRRRRA